MATKQIRIGEDCLEILERWRHDTETEGFSDAIRRMDRHLKKHNEVGVRVVI